MQNKIKTLASNGLIVEFAVGDLNGNALLSSKEVKPSTKSMDFSHCSSKFSRVEGSNCSQATFRSKNDQAHTRKVKMLKQRQMYRRRVKIERAELQQQKIKFSEKLAQLKHEKIEEQARLDASRSPDYVYWKAFATRQRELALVSQEVKKQLTAAVLAQTKYIEALRELTHENLDTSTPPTEDEEEAWPSIPQDELFEALLSLELDL